VLISIGCDGLAAISLGVKFGFPEKSRHTLYWPEIDSRSDDLNPRPAIYKIRLLKFPNIAQRIQGMPAGSRPETSI
jgi:hypothetical protein